MSTGKTVTGVAGANVTAQAGTEAVLPAVPFLEAPLFTVMINGAPAVMTPQALIVVTTGVLSILALLSSIYGKLRGKKIAATS